MKLVRIPEKREEEMLAEFCKQSTFTFVGIDIKSKEGKKALDDLERLMRVTGYEDKHCVGYWCTGDVINKHCSLTGQNAYDNELVFLFIPGYYNSKVKCELNARWFDDVVSSNIIKQNALIFNHEPDFE